MSEIIEQKIKRKKRQKDRTLNGKITLYFGIDAKQKLIRVAKKEGMSMSFFVDTLIMQYKE